MRWQPSSLDLATALAEHAGHRGAVLATDALLRFRYGKALTSRRYDRLWQRMGNRLPGVALQGIFTHWLRHTTLTWGERTSATASAAPTPATPTPPPVRCRGT